MGQKMAPINRNGPLCMQRDREGKCLPPPEPWIVASVSQKPSLYKCLISCSLPLSAPHGDDVRGPLFATRLADCARSGDYLGCSHLTSGVFVMSTYSSLRTT